MDKRKPAHSVRVGRVEAAIWENESQSGTFYNVTFSAKYRAEAGLKNSSSFSGFDLLSLIRCAAEAATWIGRAERRSEQDDQAA